MCLIYLWQAVVQKECVLGKISREAAEHAQMQLCGRKNVLGSVLGFFSILPRRYDALLWH